MTSKTMQCPSCGATFQSEVMHFGFVPILQCPSCGPVADVPDMFANIQAIHEDTVAVTMTSADPKLLAQALKQIHPDFQDRGIGDALKHVRENAVGGSLTIKLPRLLAGMAEALVGMKYPGLAVSVTEHTHVSTA